MVFIGKYIRHLMAIIAGFVVAFLAQTLGINVTEEQRVALDAALNALGMFIVLVVYAVFEKGLKNLPWLDPAGYADKIRSAAEGERIQNTGKAGN